MRKVPEGPYLTWHRKAIKPLFWCVVLIKEEACISLDGLKLVACIKHS